MKERLPSYPYQQIDQLPPPPEFDISAASIAYADAGILISELTTDAMPAVNSALALVLYNRGLKIDDADIETVRKRAATMTRNEIISRHPDNPLPTIGIEIELPTQHILRQARRNYLPYDDLADAFGFPHNYNNGEYPEYGERNNAVPTFWEVAPDFSYHHLTQQTIVSELARLRLITRFAQATFGKLMGQNEDILARNVYTSLSRQGYALHGNIGEPNGIEETLGYEADLRILNALLSLSFSSTQRLDVEAIEKPFKMQRNSACKSSKSDWRQSRRLEFRALEVLGKRSLRTLEALQLCSAALFAANKTEKVQPELARIWEGLRDGAMDIFPEDLHNYEVVALGDSLVSREAILSIAEKTPEILDPVRNLVLTATAAVHEHLRGTGWEEKHTEPDITQEISH